jgi:hypothetical protein
MAARTAVVAGTATAVSGNVARRQQQRAYQAEEAHQYEVQQEAAAQQAAAEQAAAQQAAYQQPAPAAAPAGDDMMAQLTQLGQLHAQGVLSDDEFAAAKAKLLS